MQNVVSKQNNAEQQNASVSTAHNQETLRSIKGKHDWQA